MPWGVVGAGLVAVALVLLPPWATHDAAIAARVRAYGAEAAPAVAVVLDGRNANAARRIMDLARAAGAASVEGPATESLARAPLPATSARVREVDGRALMEGRVPLQALSGQVVIVDVAERARARAAARAGFTVRPLGDGAAAGLAAVAAALAVLVAVASSRLRGKLGLALTAVTTAIVAGAIAGASLRGRALPAVELMLIAPIAVVGGRLDAARQLRRAFFAMAAPLYRATAATRGRDVEAAAAAVGPDLAELLDARGLLLLTAAPGARRVRVAAGWRLGEGDLPPRAPLDPRSPPFRDAAGLPRLAPADALCPGAPGARLLPLAASGQVEGWLLVVPASDGADLERTPEAAQAVARALGVALRGERLGGRSPARWAAPEHDGARALAEAAASLDAEAALLETAAARAHTGLLLATPAGATRWKNGRFDTLLPAPRGQGDLARVLGTLRHPGETTAGALERVLCAPGPVRGAAPDLAVVVTVTPLRAVPGGPVSALLVEAEPVDAATAAALGASRVARPVATLIEAARPDPRARDVAAAPQGGTSATSRPIGS